MGLGEFFALSSAAVWAVAVIQFRRSGESMAPFPLNLFKNVLTFALMIPTVALVEGLAWPGIAMLDVAVLLLSGVIGIALADTIYFQALNTIGASRTGIVASLFSPSVVLLSYLFLGERLSSTQWLGFGAVLGGVILVSRKPDARDVDTPDLRRGVALGAIAVFLMAVGVVMVKSLLEQEPFLWVVQIRLVGGVLGMIGVMALRGRTARVLAQLRAPHDWRQIIVASVLGTYVSLLLWMAGYKYAPASIASVLNETASIFIVLLAWLLLREPLDRRRGFGVTLTFSGVVLMLL